MCIRDSLRELLDRGPAHLSGELLKDAVSEGSRDVVRMCLQKGPALTDGLGRHGCGSLGLMIALINRAYPRAGETPPAADAERALLGDLLDYGVNVHDCDNDGQTAMHWMSMIRSNPPQYDALRTIATALLDAGADIDAVATGGLRTTPLGYAAYHMHKELVLFYLSLGARLDLPTEADFQPLALARSRSQHDISAILRSHQ